MLSCHLVWGLPLVLLPSYRASDAMRGYLDSGILATWLNLRSCICWICDCTGFMFSAIWIVWLRTLSLLVFRSTLNFELTRLYCTSKCLKLLKNSVNYKRHREILQIHPEHSCAGEKHNTSLSISKNCCLMWSLISWSCLEGGLHIEITLPSPTDWKFFSLFYNTFSVTRLYSVDDRVTSEWWW
jgi:hypothetical protein